MSEFNALSAGTTEAELRQFFAYFYRQNVGTPGFADEGVVAGLQVAQTATASASVLVGLGYGVTQSSLTTGLDPLVNNAEKTLDVLTASPMGALPRNDLVVFDGATESIRVLVGSPNASPTDPAFGARQLRLARLRHAANATTVPAAKIDDLRVFTTLNAASSQWVSTTPVFTNTIGESLAVNDGTITGKYRVSGSGAGQMVTFTGRLTRGANTNVGTGGSWAITLPVPAADLNSVGSGLQTVGSAKKPLSVEIVNSTTIVFNDVAGNRITPSNPGGTAASQNGHAYQWSITYPVS